MQQDSRSPPGPPYPERRPENAHGILEALTCGSRNSRRTEGLDLTAEAPFNHFAGEFGGPLDNKPYNAAQTALARA